MLMKSGIIWDCSRKLTWLMLMVAIWGSYFVTSLVLKTGWGPAKNTYFVDAHEKRATLGLLKNTYVVDAHARNMGFLLC